MSDLPENDLRAGEKKNIAFQYHLLNCLEGGKGKSVIRYYLLTLWWNWRLSEDITRDMFLHLNLLYWGTWNILTNTREGGWGGGRERGEGREKQRERESEFKWLNYSPVSGSWFTASIKFIRLQRLQLDYCCLNILLKISEQTELTSNGSLRTQISVKHTTC